MHHENKKHIGYLEDLLEKEAHKNIKLQFLIDEQNIKINELKNVISHLHEMIDKKIFDNRQLEKEIEKLKNELYNKPNVKLHKENSFRKFFTSK